MKTDLHARIQRLEEKISRRGSDLDDDYGLDMRGYQMTKQRVESHESKTIPAGHSLVIGDELTVEGEIVVKGTLKVV